MSVGTRRPRACPGWVTIHSRHDAIACTDPRRRKRWRWSRRLDRSPARSSLRADDQPCRLRTRWNGRRRYFVAAAGTAAVPAATDSFEQHALGLTGGTVHFALRARCERRALAGASARLARRDAEIALLWSRDQPIATARLEQALVFRPTIWRWLTTDGAVLVAIGDTRYPCGIVQLTAD